MQESFKKKLLKRIVQVIIILVIFYFIFDQLYKNWGEISGQKWEINYLYLIIAFILFIIYFVLVGVGWHLVINQFSKLSLKQSLKIRLISDLGRFVPGKVWLVLGRLYFCKKEGISNTDTLTSIVLEVGINVLAAALVFFISIPLWFDEIKLAKSLLITLIVVVAGGLILLHPAIFRRIINFGLKIIKRAPIRLNISYKRIFLILLFYVFSWFVMGAASFILINAFSPVNLDKFIVMTGIFAVSWTIGFLSFITPGGLGVREGILSYLLSFYMPISLGILVALITRIMSMICEVILAIVLWKAVK